jgi:hypothetical protein
MALPTGSSAACSGDYYLIAYSSTSINSRPIRIFTLACCLEIVIFVIYVRSPWGDKSGMFIVQL